MALKSPTMDCMKREISTKSHLNNLKRDGYIPAIVYEKGQESIPITVGDREINRTFSSHGARGIFTLNIAGEAEPFMTVIRELQRHPITGKILHIDFMAINVSETFTSSVSIHFIGEEKATKDEGVIQFGLTVLEVECLPKDLPDNIACDISELEIGDHITVADIEPPQGVVFLDEPDMVIVSVLAPDEEIEEETDEELEDLEGVEDVEGEEETEDAEETDSE
ncbi:MAG TPA: 50S ribosomal protein L25 [Syntrophomonadaceae bacterium]|nr:50S ribosomal protein L25 [Syntrophomonadaceae bacterium]